MANYAKELRLKRESEAQRALDAFSRAVEELSIRDPFLMVQIYALFKDVESGRLTSKEVIEQIDKLRWQSERRERRERRDKHQNNPAPTEAKGNNDGE